MYHMCQKCLLKSNPQLLSCFSDETIKNIDDDELPKDCYHSANMEAASKSLYSANVEVDSKSLYTNNMESDTLSPGTVNSKIILTL